MGAKTKIKFDPTKMKDWEIAYEAEKNMKTLYELAEELGLIKEELITEEFYKKRRLYFLGFFYVLSLLLSPTDFFTQILLTLFLFLFFRLAFFIAKFFK